MPPLIMCRYNGVIPYNMPLLTTNIRIVFVSIPYRFRIVLLLSFYRSPIGKRKQYGNNTETIRKRTNDKRMRNDGTRVVNLTIIVNSYDNGKTQTNYCGCKYVIYRLITKYLFLTSLLLLHVRQESCDNAEQWQKSTYLKDKLNARFVG